MPAVTKSVSPTALSTATAEALLTTAERLYGERGIDAVSMREISRESGQKNSSALQYHFDSKQALITAILVRRMNALDYRRLENLDRLEAQGQDGDLRSLVAAIVMPMAESLTAAKRQSAIIQYIGFLSAVQNHPDHDLLELSAEARNLGLGRGFRLIAKQLPQVPPAILQQRYIMMISQVIHALAEFERLLRRRRGSRRPFNIERAIENLIDMTTGALAAPVSPACARHTAA